MTPREVAAQIIPYERRWFFLLVILSLLFHLFFFMLVRIELPRSGTLAMRTPRAVMLLPGSIAGENMDLWLDWRNPAAIAFPRSPLPDIQISHKPISPTQTPTAEPASIFTGPDMLRDLPGTAEQRILADLPPTIARPQPIRVEAPPPLRGTRFNLHGALATRPLIGSTELPQPRTDLSPRTTTLSLAVNQLGKIENIFILESSGDPAVDTMGLNEVRNWSFAPDSSSDLQWGTMVIFWDFRAKISTP